MGTGKLEQFGGLLTRHPTSASSKESAFGTNNSFFQEREKKKGKKTEKRLVLFHSRRSLVVPEVGGVSLVPLPPLRGAGETCPGMNRGGKLGRLVGQFFLVWKNIPPQTSCACGRRASLQHRVAPATERAAVTVFKPSEGTANVSAATRAQQLCPQQSTCKLPSIYAGPGLALSTFRDVPLPRSRCFTEGRFKFVDQLPLLLFTNLYFKLVLNPKDRLWEGRRGKGREADDSPL